MAEKSLAAAAGAASGAASGTKRPPIKNLKEMLENGQKALQSNERIKAAAKKVAENGMHTVKRAASMGAGGMRAAASGFAEGAYPDKVKWVRGIAGVEALVETAATLYMCVNGEANTLSAEMTNSLAQSNVAYLGSSWGREMGSQWRAGKESPATPAATPAATQAPAAPGPQVQGDEFAGFQDFVDPTMAGEGESYGYATPPRRRLGKRPGLRHARRMAPAELVEANE